MRKVMLSACATTVAALSCASNGAIVVDGSFADWASVPAIATSIDNGITGAPDFKTLKVSNDSSYMYFYYELQRAENPQGGSGVFLGIDADNNTGTGFNVFGLGILGSEAGWQNDEAFEQAVGNFNTGAGLSNASYGAAPYAALTTEVEIRIPMTALRNSNSQSLFVPDTTIGVMFYTVDSADWVIGQYTIVPEPASLGLCGLGALLLNRRRTRA